jgi:NAD(P)-dependent dehydrogenase (short-subunit alcohol dehydrogenase family)
MHILIIGGTRFMGPYVVRNLCAAGHEVSVFHRGQTRAELPEGVKEILDNRNCLPEYASDFQRLSPEVVLDMVAMHEQHARDLMMTFTGVAKRVVVVSSQDVYRSFGSSTNTKTARWMPCQSPRTRPCAQSSTRIAARR